MFCNCYENIKEKVKLKELLCSLSKQKLVNTRGHAGHIYIKASKSTCDITICSIYVNPTQFNSQRLNPPTNTKKDIELLKKNHCDILFANDFELYEDNLKAVSLT